MTLEQLLARASRGPLLLDGAMSTFLHASAGAHGPVAPSDALTSSQPEAVRAVHDAYLEAGADIVRTNTFRAASRAFADRARETSRTAASLARAAADACSLRTPLRPRLVAGALGPADIDAGSDDLPRAFREPLIGLLDGGIDLVLFETWWSPAQTRAALEALDGASAETGRRVPVILSTVVRPDGRLAGSGAPLAEWLSALDPDAVQGVGLNCGHGPAGLTAALRELAGRPWLVSCAPSAGLPDGEGRYPYEPEAFARELAPYASGGLAHILGGCCGTTPAHVAALAARVASTSANAVATPRRAGTQ